MMAARFDRYGGKERQCEFVGAVNDDGFFRWKLFFGKESLQSALLDVGNAVCLAVVLSDEEAFQCAFFDKLDEGAHETFVLFEKREVLCKAFGANLCFELLHFRCIGRIAAQCVAVGETRVGEEIFVVIVVVNAGGRNHARQDGKSVKRHLWMCGMQLAQIGGEYLDFGR